MRDEDIACRRIASCGGSAANSTMDCLLWKTRREMIFSEGSQQGSTMSSVSIRPLDDEWWTTAMVCSYLKLKRRALWDIRRDPTKAFPAAVKPGGKVNLFRAEDVRVWVAKRRPSHLPPPQLRAVAPEKPQIVATTQAKAPATIIAPQPVAKPVQRKRAPVADDRQLGLF
jgi:predicted DNA-binding transcriptional regulator AlpA